tara:strand:+ start:6110 stop:7408 length:1299 start_codon:yes stop_codon:yes gene_type:complete
MQEILILINVIILIYTIKKTGGASPAGIASIYITICIASFYVINYLQLTKEMLLFTAMPINDYQGIDTTVISVYTGLNLLSFICAYTAQTNTIKTQQLRTYRTKPNFKIGQNATITICVIFIGLNCANLLHLMSLDIDTLLSNRSYLTIKTPEEIGITNPAARIYHFLFRFIGAISVIILCEALYQRNLLISILSFTFFMYCATLLAAGASRWLAVYIALAALYVYIRKPRYAKTITAALIALTFFSFIFVLLGRASGTYGIAHLGEYINKFNPQILTLYIGGIFVNVFEGAFNLANSIILDPQFNPWYIHHSFLPLFSFMDGFSGKISQLAWKFAPHVPMSAISETYTFGNEWFLIYVCMYFSMLLLASRVYTSDLSFHAKMALMAPTYYIIIAQHTYSLRTMMKPTLFLIILFSLILIVKRKTRPSGLSR